MSHEANATLTASQSASDVLSKVPAVTLTFWIIKILATTLGETGGDAVTMTMNLGYLIGTAIFLTLLVALVGAADPGKEISPIPLLGDDHRFDDRRHDDGRLCRPILGRRLHGRIVDLVSLRHGCSRCSGIGQRAQLRSKRSASPRPKHSIGQPSHSPRRWELHWVTGWRTHRDLAFSVPPSCSWRLSAIVAVLYFWTDISRVLLFWAAFILTRPLGATVGDFLDKPLNQGGLNFSRPLATAIIAVGIVVCILLTPQRAGRHPGAMRAS